MVRMKSHIAYDLFLGAFLPTFLWAASSYPAYAQSRTDHGVTGRPIGYAGDRVRLTRPRGPARLHERRIGQQVSNEARGRVRLLKYDSKGGAAAPERWRCQQRRGSHL